MLLPIHCVWLWNMAPLLITHVRCQMQDGPVLKACVHECAIIWNVELAIGCLCFVQYAAVTGARVKTCPQLFFIQATLIERIVPGHTAVNFARTSNDPPSYSSFWQNWIGACLAFMWIVLGHTAVNFARMKQWPPAIFHPDKTDSIIDWPLCESSMDIQLSILPEWTNSLPSVGFILTEFNR